MRWIFVLVGLVMGCSENSKYDFSGVYTNVHRQPQPSLFSVEDRIIIESDENLNTYKAFIASKGQFVHMIRSSPNIICTANKGVCFEWAKNHLLMNGGAQYQRIEK